MEIKNVTEDLTDKFGAELDSTGYYDRGNRAEATVIYSSGIPNFDEIFYPHKFEETNCLVEILSYENCIIIFLMLPNAKTISNYLIWRKDIISFEFEEDKRIEVPKFELVKALTPLGPGSGLIGGAIAETRLNKFLKKKQFKLVGSKQKDGKTVKLKYFDQLSKKNKNIKFNLPDNYHHFTNDFFIRHWKSELSNEDKTSSKCYIATACYNNKNAEEVIFLRAFRDNVLYRNMFGRMLIQVYYKLSPSIVKYFYSNRMIKETSKLFLDQLIKFLKKLQSVK